MQCQGPATGGKGRPTDHSRPVCVAQDNPLSEPKLTVHTHRHIWEAMRYVWPESHWPGEENLAGIESRL